MTQELFSERKPAFEKVIEHFVEEAAKLRTGRAHPGLVENIMVDYYGNKTPLKQLATITIPEGRQIVIQPWDKNALGEVETALRNSELNLNPSNDGSLIRLTLPALTEESRETLVKTLNQKAEASRISIRNIREEIWQEIQKRAETGRLSEDDKFRGKDELQKVVDEYNKKIESLREKKEKEILTV